MANIPINHYKKFIYDYRCFMEDANSYLTSMVTFEGDKEILRDKSIELTNTVNMLINSLDSRSDKDGKYIKYRNDLIEMKSKIEKPY